MSIAINSNFERDQVQATSAGQTVFTYSFPIFDQKYIKVYKRGAATPPDDSTQLLAIGTDYTVTGVGVATGGTIVLVVGAAIGDIITMVGAEPIERQTVFQDLNPFTVALNQQLNEQTVMQQQTYTYWANITPHYNFDELVSTYNTLGLAVRPFKLILPMLPSGHTWVGRGEIGDIPDDITTAFVGGGSVMPDHPGMRPSIALWTGTDFVLTDSDINISGAFFTKAPSAPESITGFSNLWGAMHWPAHGTADRPGSPQDGDTYYDEDTNQFFGYVNGVWVPFSTGGGGGGNDVHTFTQPLHGFVPGDVIRVNAVSIYVKAQADTVQNAEVIGIVISVPDINTFTVQQSGYLDTGVFVGLTPGDPYYLHTAVAGAITNVDANVIGQISRPVLIADTATSGWIVPYRGIIVGGGTIPTPPTPTPNPNIVPIVQPMHGLAVGDVVRLDGSIDYVEALADTLAHAQAVGVVIEVVSVNEFILQTSGYNVGAITQDDAAAPIVAAGVYYLSPTVPGAVTLTVPTGLNEASKPIYISEQVFGTTGVDAGYILEQRPLAAAVIPPPPVPATIVETEFTGTFETTASGWVDIGLCATLTTTTAFQTIFISANVTLASDGSSGVGFRIVRNGVPIDTGTVAGSRTSASGTIFSTQLQQDSALGAPEFYIDAPGAAGIYTYCIEVFKGNSGFVRVNYGGNDTNSANYYRATSSLLLMIMN